MTAALGRAELAAIGADLVATEGARGERRAAALLARLGSATTGPRPAFTDLGLAPRWLRLPRMEQTRLAHAAALASLAPMLAASIDGDWLGGLAKVAGEDLIDWAIELPDCGGELELAPVDPKRLTGHGFGLLRAGLPPALRAYVAWAPGAVSDAESGCVATWTRAAADRVMAS